MLYNCHQRSDNSYMMSDVYQQLYYSCYQTSGLRARIHALTAAFIENVLILKFAYEAEKLPLGLSINGFLDDTNLCIARGLSDVPQKNL